MSNNIFLGNPVVTKYEKIYEIGFSFYDYRYIEEDILNYLIKKQKEIYRKGYAVLFKFETAKDEEWRKFLDWVNEIEVGDDYKYICLGESYSDVEDVGCMCEFDLEVTRHMSHDNTSEISPNPCEVKSLVLNDHDAFDLKVKNGVR